MPPPAHQSKCSSVAKCRTKLCSCGANGHGCGKPQTWLLGRGLRGNPPPPLVNAADSRPFDITQTQQRDGNTEDDAARTQSPRDRSINLEVFLSHVEELCELCRHRLRQTLMTWHRCSSTCSQDKSGQLAQVVLACCGDSAFESSETRTRGDIARGCGLPTSLTSQEEIHRGRRKCGVDRDARAPVVVCWHK